MNNYPNSAFVFCMDGSKSFRKNIYPEYKAGRKRPDDLWDNYLEIMETVAGLDKVLFAFNDLYEADDIMFTLVKEYYSYLSPLFLYTSDQDMDPYLTNNVQTGVFKFTQIRGGAPVPIVLDSREDVLGYHPIHMIGVKTICGDPHNSVKGFKYFQKKSAQEIIKWVERSGISLMDMIRGTFPENMPKNLIQMIRKRSEIEGSVDLTIQMLERNQKLVTLVKVPNLRLVQLEGSFDPLQKISNLMHKTQHDERIEEV
jgi:5'-3' exonuclease